MLGLIKCPSVQPYYEQDGITIYHADCREVLPYVSGVDLVLTDPPYGIGFKYGESYCDAPDTYRAWMQRILPDLLNIAPLAMISMSMRHMWILPEATHVMCWAKPGAMTNNPLGGFSQWEPIFVYGQRRIYNDFKYLPARTSTARERQLEGARIQHPCPKPLELYLWLIGIGTDAGQLVLDPFMGSGTALRAAKDLGRRAIGIEIEERYCEVAARRLSQQVLDLAV